MGASLIPLKPLQKPPYVHPQLACWLTAIAPCWEGSSEAAAARGLCCACPGASEGLLSTMQSARGSAPAGRRNIRDGAPSRAPASGAYATVAQGGLPQPQLACRAAPPASLIAPESGSSAARRAVALCGECACKTACRANLTVLPMSS